MVFEGLGISDKVLMEVKEWLWVCLELLYVGVFLNLRAEMSGTLTGREKFPFRVQFQNVLAVFPTKGTFKLRLVPVGQADFWF